MKIKLFPDLQPSAQGWLDVGDGHAIHWQTSGNPAGRPVVWLHGGPGSSASPLHRRFLDPARFWLIQYDQRGCGRSLPQGGIHANETSKLIQDIERLRHHLGIARWGVVGGSWGGALALLYAQTHPDVVDKMLLRSPFLCTASEINDFMEKPPAACRALWQGLKDLVSVSTPETILALGYRTFCVDQDRQAQLALAQAWIAYEAAMNVYPAQPAVSMGVFEEDALIARYRVQSHYLQHLCFVEHPVLARAQALRGLSLTLVHGDLDALCPFENSIAIQRAVPQATVVTVAGGGHDLAGEGMLAATYSALQQW